MAHNHPPSCLESSNLSPATNLMYQWQNSYALAFQARLRGSIPRLILQFMKKYIVKIIDYDTGEEISPGVIFKENYRDYNLKYIFDKCCDRIFAELERDRERKNLIPL